MKQRVIWAVLFEISDFGDGWADEVNAFPSRAKARAYKAFLDTRQYYRNVRVVRFQASPGQGLRAYE